MTEKKIKRVKKWSTSITDRNGGMHSPVNYRKARNMLLTHPYRNGRMYHIVFTGSEDRKVYRYIVEQLCKQLRAKGMPCMYKACYERDKKKRFHKHLMLLVEAGWGNPDSIIHYAEGHWLTGLAKSKGIEFTIAEPDDPMHLVGGKQVNYVYVPKKAGPKLEDALIRISYLYKVRSKEGVEGQIYTASTNREPKKPSLPIAALPAAEETEHNAGTNEEQFETAPEALPIGSLPGANQEGSSSTSDEALVCTGQCASASEEATSQQEANPMPYDQQDSGRRAGPSYKGIEVNLTPAQKYLSTLYERCVDADMDTSQIRRYLLTQGVVKTPGQVAYELEHIFSFYGYADSHEPRPEPTIAEWDKAIDRGICPIKFAVQNSPAPC